ncbi:hypothetical protein RRF57_006171 [Xylaria bambusicola]|uniref:Cyclic nucleotide-binding domain-containing protein n=1 Tax=Xylaria bambusicola TaxID=326684 RepID=A0AAN7Z9P1_9PEZI
MRRARTPPSPYRALAHHPANGQLADSASLIRSFNIETNPARPIRPSPLTASTFPDMPLDLVDRMRSFPLFMSASEDFLVAIGKYLRPQVHAAHDHILTEGDEAKAMYWLVRGVVAVTSRDGEAIYAELKPGSFFGEIGVLMNVPRTATIIARTKCLLLVLKKEDLQLELPKFPDMDKAIRHEAHERLAITAKKRQESGRGLKLDHHQNTAREAIPGEVATGEEGVIKDGVVNNKKRKSPSPGALEDPAAGSALGSGGVNVRQTLKELPLFSTLPPDILHQLGLNAQPKTYAPFTDIIRQGTLGNEIYFIVRGEAEVIHEPPEGQVRKRSKRSSLIRPRLRQGQYFGEVASLGLSQKRTATVRSITVVECLMISGEALDELWRKCPSGLREQVEETARNRIRKDDGEDVDMTDAESMAGDSAPVTPVQANPQVTFTTPSKPASPVKDESKQLIPKDPDPYLSVDMENLRNRRRASLAPPTPPSDSPGTPSTNGGRPQMIDTTTPIKFAWSSMSSPVSEGPTKKARLSTKPITFKDKGERKKSLPDDILITIFQHLNAVDLFRLRSLSTHWLKVLSTSLKLCHNVDLSVYNRRVTDDILVNRLAPFLGHRPISVDVSNCFHITDEGFSSFWRLCGRNVKIWKMKSVWEVSANQILEMSDHAKSLEEVDWSNCRKVGDNLLARVVGWVVPDHPPQKQVVISSSAARLRNQRQQAHTVTLPPPGTVIGCPQLKRLNLSYCKHITDRSMAHMAAHASNRLQSLSLTRCTSITDAGFQSWAAFRFVNLSHLCLADCTYLSDNAIVALVNAAKSLTHLDLSFCCALSDTATEVVALGLPRLQELKMAFCGSAVSDSSLACISLHLNDLERLSVRGCVRVTASGVESVLEGCGRLAWIDVSQCRNLEGWINGGGVTRWGYDERTVRISGIDIKSMSIIPPRGARNRRARRPVGFVVEKGTGELPMKQWVTNQDGLDKLQFVDVPEPSELKESEVLVQIQSVSLNYRDTEERRRETENAPNLVCMGLYSHHKSIGNDKEIIPTSDCCGVIVKAGPGATESGLREGDRVASIFNQTHQTGQVVEKDMASGLGLPLDGCLTQYRVFPAYGLVKVPEYLTDDEAACLPIAAVTAWMGINSFQPMGQPLQGKDKVVLLQGTGGVAISGLQIAKASGLTTIITSSSDKKLELAKSLGADHIINYKTTPNWDDTVLELTQGRGADVVLECGGAQTLSKSFRCVAFGGLISAIGYLSGKEDEAGNRMNANVLALSRNVTFKGILNGPKDRFGEMLRVYEREQIRPVVDRTFEFEKADEALKYLFSGGHFGKVVVRVQ